MPSVGNAAIFCLHAFFDEDARQLGAEILWDGKEPAVGSMNPNGVAAMRGIVPGDTLVECNGVSTSAVDRQHVLGLLKARPLFLKLHRVCQADGVHSAHIQLKLSVCEAIKDQDIDFVLRGQMVIIASVREGSSAWAAGLLASDVLLSVNNVSAAAASWGMLRVLLQQQPLLVTVRRRAVSACDSTLCR